MARWGAEGQVGSRPAGAWGPASDWSGRGDWRQRGASAGQGLLSNRGRGYALCGAWHIARMWFKAAALYLGVRIMLQGTPCQATGGMPA